MTFEITPISTATADGILAWCGVTSPTPGDTAVVHLAADAAERTINHFRHTNALEPEYASLAVEIGVYLYSKRGVDGVVSFNENGVARSFEKGSVPPSMLARIRLPMTAGPS